MTAPYFPQFANEFLADVSGWPIEAVGAYARLQCQAWKDDPVGSLPNDDEVLALKAGVNLVLWREIRPIALSLCKTGTDGRVHFPRLRTAFEEHRRYSKSRSENAKRGWDKRKGDAPARAPARASSSPDAYASDVQSTRNEDAEHMVCLSSALASATSSAPTERESRARAGPDARPRDDLASPSDGFEGAEDGLAPDLTPIEVALCRVCGWVPDRLDHNQWYQVKNAVKLLDAHGDVTTERIGLAGEFYRSQRKFSFGPTWIGRDWGQIREWLRAQEAGQPAIGASPRSEARRQASVDARRKLFGNGGTR